MDFGWRPPKKTGASCYILDQQRIVRKIRLVKNNKVKMGERGGKQHLNHTILVYFWEIPNLHLIHHTTKDFISKYIICFFRYLFIDSLPTGIINRRVTGDLYKNSPEKINIFLLIFSLSSCMIYLQNMGNPNVFLGMSPASICLKKFIYERGFILWQSLI